MSLSEKEYRHVCLDLVMTAMMIDRKRKSLALFKGDLSINRKIDVASTDFKEKSTMTHVGVNYRSSKTMLLHTALLFFDDCFHCHSSE